MSEGRNTPMAELPTGTVTFLRSEAPQAPASERYSHVGVLAPLHLARGINTTGKHRTGRVQ